jgi:hypothetical protein
MERLLGYLSNGLHELESDAAHQRILASLLVASPLEKEAIDNFLFNVSGFFMDTDSDALNKMMSGAQDAFYRTPERDALYAKITGSMMGVVMKKIDAERGAVFLPDVSEPGRVRFSEFDESGFFSHQTFDDYREAFHEAWGQGYQSPTDIAWFESLSSTERWSKGMDVVNKIAAWNRGDKMAFEPPVSHDTQETAPTPSALHRKR